MEKISKANEGAIGEEGNCWNKASMDNPYHPWDWDIHLDENHKNQTFM